MARFGHGKRNSERENRVKKSMRIPDAGPVRTDKRLYPVGIIPGDPYFFNLPSIFEAASNLRIDVVDAPRQRVVGRGGYLSIGFTWQDHTETVDGWRDGNHPGPMMVFGIKNRCVVRERARITRYILEMSIDRDLAVERIDVRCACQALFREKRALTAGINEYAAADRVFAIVAGPNHTDTCDGITVAFDAQRASR